MTNYKELLAHCQNIPVVSPGFIQAHGMLFGISNGDHKIEFFSENAAEFLGEHCFDWVGQVFRPDLHPCFAGIDLSTDENQISKCDGVEVRVSVSAKHRLIEICREASDASVMASCVGVCIGKLIKARNSENLHQTVLEAMHELIGFGHLMIYKFDESWNGQVVAEWIKPEKEDTFDAYLNLCFPESDIPRQARDMYQRFWVRNTADVESDAVRLLIEPAKSPQLASAYLRGIAASHVQYLKNMQVRASFSCSIIVEGKLWGLIAAHNDQPSPLDFSTLDAAEEIAKLYSAMMEMFLRKERQEWLAQNKTMVAWPAQSASQGNDPFMNIAEQFPLLLERFQSCGVVAWDGMLKSSEGEIPNEAQLRNIIENLRDASFENNIFSSNKLAKDFALDEMKFAGLLALGVPKEADRFVLIFRKEEPQEVSWGGDPRVQQMSLQNGMISPRNSFHAWKETLLGVSRPWEMAEIALAELLANNLNLANSTLSTMENAQKSAKLNLLNMLLHDIGNALSGVMGHVTQVRHLSEDQEALLNLQKICGFIDQQITPLERALGQAKAKGLQQLMNEISRSGFQKTEDISAALMALETGMTHARELLDLQKTYAQSASLYARECHISQLVSDALSVLRTSIEQRGSICINYPPQLPMMNVDRSKLMQVIINLIKNAFEAWDAREEPKPAFQLEIDANVEETKVILNLRDNGVGLSESDAARLFEANFSTKERSSGLGLANCKRLAKATGVELSLESDGLNQGATAHLIFSKELWV